MITRKRKLSHSTVLISALMKEAISGIVQRPGRSMLTVVGTVLGVGAFVAVLGLTATANGQISESFNKLSATQLTVEQRRSGEGSASLLFPRNAERRVEQIDGVLSASLYWQVTNAEVSALPPAQIPLQHEASSVSIFAISPDFLETVETRILSGRAYDSGLSKQRVVVLGALAARSLGIADVREGRTIFINDIPFLVIGIVDQSQRLSSVGSAVLIPTNTALKSFGHPEAGASMLVKTDVGAATVVARQSPYAVDAQRPENFEAVALASPTVLRDAVSADLGSLFLGLAGVCLLVGVVGIANVNLMAVVERVPEIGLRRSMGALPRHIGFQFLTESAILGALGGLIGSSVGIGATILVAVLQDWTATVAPWTVIAAPAMGGLVGLAAGFYPAMRAAHIEPIEAFRR